MNKELGLKFAEILSQLEGKDYIEAMVAFGAAPTIQGKKPSSLMTFNGHGKNTLSLWKDYGTEICELFQLEQFELRRNEHCIIVLLYRRRMLERYVNHHRNQPFLRKMGYGFLQGLDKKLDLLKARFEDMCPHEIGVFLGMPVEDVEGFIEHKGQNGLFCGYWKVYDNTRRAELIFNAYDQARRNMVELFVNLSANKMAQCV